MWSGAKANVTPAGDAFWQAVCVHCGVELEAYWDVFRDDGSVDEFPVGSEPELHWSRPIRRK